MQTHSYILLALSLIFSAASSHEFVANLNLSGKSFKLDVTYHHEDKNGSGATYDIEEFHSAPQRRSRLHYKLHGRENGLRVAQRSTLYSHHQHTFMVESAVSGCDIVYPDWHDKVFNLGALGLFEWSYLIGAARLLAFVEQNSDKFSVLTHKELVHDVKLGASFQSGQSDEFSVLLFYDGDLEQNLPNGVPRQIIIVLQQSGQMILYDFLRYQTLDGHFQTSTSNFVSLEQYAGHESNWASFDLFMLDADCSSLVGESPGNNLDLAGRDSVRFSFNARPRLDRVPTPLDLAIVYEPTLAVLKIQQNLASGLVSSLSNFGLNRKYHVARRLASGWELDSILRQDEGENYSCVVSRVKGEHLAESDRNPFTVGQMLFGTDRLFFVGRARVRGVVTRVYESQHCDWPIWLQQPTAYEQTDEMPRDKGDGQLAASGRLVWRDEAKLMREQEITLTNVFYFSQLDLDDGDLSRAKLVLAEFFFKHLTTGAIVKSISVPVHDFSWQLTSSSPIGARYEDTFSLQDNCLAQTNEDNDFATVDLLLEGRVEGKKLDWLQERAKRNLALLHLAQSSLRLNPVSMVYDVESRLTLTGNSSEGGQLVALSATLRAATRTRSLARVVLVCRVRNPDLAHFDSHQVFNFQACHNIASHRRKDTIFAFEIPTFTCHIMRQEFLAINEPETMLENICRFGQMTGHVELYIIWHHKEVAQTAHDQHQGLAFVRDALQSLETVQLIDSQSWRDPGTTIALKLRSFDVRPLNERASYEVDGNHQETGNNFPGFGLLESDARNKLVRPMPAEERPIDDQGPSSISFEHCQTACLADMDCRSYSVCFKRGELQCILTNVSFNTPAITRQLLKLRQAKSKFGQQFQLNVDADGQTIDVVKHPACELHKKLYESYFKSDGLSKSTRSVARAKMVASREQCAALCFQLTVDYLKEVNRPETEDERSVPQTNSQERRVCDRFYYIEARGSDSRAPNKTSGETSAGDGQQNVDLRGYCYLDEPATNGDRNQAEIVDRPSRLEIFNFDYATLYSKQLGVSLIESPATESNPIQLEHDQVGPRSGSKAATVTGNFGSLKQCFSVQDCARVCFNPKSQVALPRCRSFDYFEIKSQPGPTQKLCAFNSVTFKSSIETGRFDLIRHGADKQQRVAVNSSDEIKVWHYEPRDILAYVTTNGLDSLGPENNRPAHQVHLNGLSFSCIIASFVVSGTVLGFILSSKLIPKTQREEIEELVER